MVGIERFLLAIYAGLLHLYPQEFHMEFGAEMQTVFAEALSVSRERGVKEVLRFLGDELRHLPLSALREYWAASRERETNMGRGAIDMSIRTVQPKNRPFNSWFEAFLAALPYILVLIIDALPRALALSGFLRGESWGMQIYSIASAVLSACILVILLVIAARRGWPLWSASWYLFFCLILLLPLGWLFSMLDFGHSEFLNQEVTFYLLIPMLLAVLLYWVTRSDRLRGLLAALPVLYFLWFVNLEQTPTHVIPEQVELLIKTICTLLITMAVMAIVRLRDWRSGYWIILGTIMVVGIQYAYVGIYHGGTLPFTAPGPSIMEVVKSFVPQYLVACSILLGLLFAWMFRKIGRRSGTFGKIGYHLALLGLLLLIAVNLLGLMVGTTNIPGSIMNLTYSRLEWLVYSALIVYIVGLIIFYVTAWRYGVLKDFLKMFLLGLLPMAIPLIFVLPLITWKWPVSRLYGIPALWVIPDGFSLAAGLVWLMLSSWLVTRTQDTPVSPVVLSYETH